MKIVAYDFDGTITNSADIVCETSTVCSRVYEKETYVFGKLQKKEKWVAAVTKKPSEILKKERAETSAYLGTVKEITTSVADYGFLITPDAEVRKDLRNPEALAMQMKKIAANGDRIIIVSKHDNAAWIKRNLSLVLNDESLVDSIKIYAMSSGEYDQFRSSKTLVIQDYITSLQRENHTVEEVTLIDDRLTEEEYLKNHLENKVDKKIFENIKVNFIHANPDNNDYLVKINQLIGTKIYAFDFLGTLTNDVDITCERATVNSLCYEKNIYIDGTFHKKERWVESVTKRPGQILKKTTTETIDGNRKEIVTSIPDYGFLIKPDKEVQQNLRNLEAHALLMKSIAEQGNQVIIVTKHDNAEWIKRNLTLILKDEKLVESIKIYPLSSDKYIDLFKGSKILAIQDYVILLQKENQVVKEVVLVDDNLSEKEYLTQHLADRADKQVFKDIKVSFVHAQDDNAYLAELNNKINGSSSQQQTLTSEKNVNNTTILLSDMPHSLMFSSQQPPTSIEETKYTNFLGNVPHG